MSKKNAAAGAVPDAWDDDWVKAADTPHAQSTPSTASAPKLSKAERRAQHLKQQKQLWDTAENPARFHWLETQGVVPLKQEFAPPVTLLSRKPPTIAKRNAADGLGQLSLEDDEDSEEEARKKREASFEERQRKAKIEREEKQRRYAEARERIMGSSNPSPSNNSANNSRDSSQARDTRRKGGKAQGNRRSQPHSPAEPIGFNNLNASAGPQLFDPEDMGRRLAPPGREMNGTPKGEGPSRQPHGPTRGGFGFAGRGGLT